jgi:hypothetical protein
MKSFPDVENAYSTKHTQRAETGGFGEPRYALDIYIRTRVDSTIAFDECDICAEN